MNWVTLANDPDKLGNLALFYRYDRAEMTLCGEVNAKNTFGAYTGYRRFYIGGRRGEPDIDEPDFAIGTRLCKAIRDVAPPILVEAGER